MQDIIPSIKIEVLLLCPRFFFTIEGEKIEKSSVEAFGDVIEQLKRNMETYAFTLVDASLQNSLDINNALSEVSLLLLEQKRAIVYAKKGDSVTEIEFIEGEEESYLRFIPIQPYAVRKYSDGYQNIDTAYYIDLALKFTYNLLLRAFVAKNF